MFSQGLRLSEGRETRPAVFTKLSAAKSIVRNSCWSPRSIVPTRSVRSKRKSIIRLADDCRDEHWVGFACDTSRIRELAIGCRLALSRSYEKIYHRIRAAKTNDSSDRR